MRQVVITGVGAIGPLGHDVESICATTEGPAEASPAPSAEAPLWPIGGFDATRFVSGRLRQKIDRFVIYGLCAAGMAIEDSRLFPGGIDRERLGIFVGNCLGGWWFTEPELRMLHTRGVRAMSPYVATAWFPAALQGQISLAHGVKGHSKTFSTFGVAGLQAIGYAAQAIAADRADAVICGAAEDLSSAYIRVITLQDLFRRDGAPSTFGAARTRPQAEGAAFLLLEDYEHAVRRGADIHCRLTGFADSFAPDEDRVVEGIRQNLSAVTEESEGPRLLILDGLFEGEASATRRAASDLGLPVGFVDSKPKFGNMFAVSGVMEAACAARSLRRGRVTAKRFEDVATAAGEYGGVIIQRLSRTGSIVTLGLGRIDPES